MTKLPLILCFLLFCECSVLGRQDHFQQELQQQFQCIFINFFLFFSQMKFLLLLILSKRWPSRVFPSVKAFCSWRKKSNWESNTKSCCNPFILSILYFLVQMSHPLISFSNYPNKLWTSCWFISLHPSLFSCCQQHGSSHAARPPVQKNNNNNTPYC